MTGIVLAGGKGLRLGRPKALEPIGNGDTLLSRVISRLKTVCSEIIVVTREDMLKAVMLYQPAADVVSDIIPDRGPLGGLYTGLQRSGTELNIAVACDMPFLNTGLITYLISLAPGWDIVVPRINGLTEQLHTVYSKRCAKTADQLIKLGRSRIADLFSHVRTHYVEEPELRSHDPELMSFFNINTETDLAKAQTLIGWEVLTGGKSQRTIR